MIGRVAGVGVWVVIALGAVACGEALDESDSAAGSLSTEALGDRIERVLRSTYPQFERRLWESTRANSLTGDWLLQIPNAQSWGQASLPTPKRCSGSNCDADFGLATCTNDSECDGGPCREVLASKKSGDAPAARLCVGHDDRILDDIYSVMTSAESNLDVTSLSAPTGRFLATLRNALTTLDAKGRTVNARFLFGSYLNHEPELPRILGELTRDMRQGSHVRVSIAAHDEGPLSWNHSKMIAVDGREAIIGGMNLWSNHYLDDEPVHDVNLHVRGPVVGSAEAFANELWNTSCTFGSVLGAQPGCPPFFSQPLVSPPGNVRMIGVGRTGQDNPAEEALITMMDSARSSIRMSQQDIGSLKFPFPTLPDRYLDAWVRAAQRGVDVNVVVSNENAFGGHGQTTEDAYFNGWSLEELWNGLLWRVPFASPQQIANLCEHVHFSRFRSIPASTWPSGMPQANHAKVVIIDEKAHYVGSQNLYNASLSEFGIIVVDPTATAQFVADYYAKLFEFSKVTTLIPARCP